MHERTTGTESPRFNRDKHDVEMHLESLCEQTIHHEGLDLSVAMRSGETIHTESSHKYSLDELDRLAQQSGFRLNSHWVNERWKFASCLYAVE